MRSDSQFVSSISLKWHVLCPVLLFAFHLPSFKPQTAAMHTLVALLCGLVQDIRVQSLNSLSCAFRFRIACCLPIGYLMASIVVAIVFSTSERTLRNLGSSARLHLARVTLGSKSSLNSSCCAFRSIKTVSNRACSLKKRREHTLRLLSSKRNKRDVR